jgi:hypothetical protein
VYDQQTEDRLLSKNPRGYWTGFQEGAQDGDQYRFWVVGIGSSGYKRDPYARELGPKEMLGALFLVFQMGHTGATAWNISSARLHEELGRDPGLSLPR